MTLEKAMQIAAAELPDAHIRSSDHGQRLAAYFWPDKDFLSPSLAHISQAELRLWIAPLRGVAPHHPHHR
jgi:hypothetical protein